jgi:hypothetical protein
MLSGLSAPSEVTLPTSVSAFDDQRVPAAHSTILPNDVNDQFYPIPSTVVSSADDGYSDDDTIQHVLLPLVCDNQVIIY